MSDFARALYADLFDGDDPDDLEHATREWSRTTSFERSFTQVHLLWMIHERLAELGTEVSSLAELLAHLDRQPEPPDVIDVEPVPEVHDA